MRTACVCSKEEPGRWHLRTALPAGEWLVSRPVVITGLGIASPIGIGVNAFWESLRTGRSGMHRVTA